MRHQFGRPIGSFQPSSTGVQTFLVEVESARSAAAYASAAVAAGGGDASVAASIAKVYCSQAFYHVAAECIQMHGGIRFTWEHPAHLYFKRAKSSEALFGLACLSPGPDRATDRPRLVSAPTVNQLRQQA